MADGRPRMVCLTGIPEMTFMSSSLNPNCCNFSTPSEAGSIFSNMARSVTGSDITSLSLLQVAERGNMSLADLADGMSFLSLLYFPDWDQGDDPRSQHIE